MTIMSCSKNYIWLCFLKLICHGSNLMKSAEAPFESDLIIGITGIIGYFCSSCPVTEHSSSTTETWHTVERVNHSEIAMLFKKLISFDPIQFLYCILGYPSWQFIIWMFAIWIIPVNNCKIKETAGSWSDPLDWCSFLLKWKLVVWCRLLNWVWRVESYLWCTLCQSQWCSRSRGQCHIRSHKLFCISCLWWCRTSWPVLSDRLAPDQVAQYLCLYFRHMAIWQYGRR